MEQEFNKEQLADDYGKTWLGSDIAWLAAANGFLAGWDACEQKLKQCNVSSSISVTANVPKQFAEAVKELHKGYNCELKQYNDYKNGWITVEVKGKKSDIERLNRECEQIAYRDVF